MVSSAADTNEGSRQYTVAVSSGTVNVALFAASSVTTVDGKTLFTSSAPINSGQASLEVVNGTVAGTAGGTEAFSSTKLAPINGSVTFTVDSLDAGAVVPVVWADAAGVANTTLDFATAPTVTAPQAPSDAFGVGGAIQYIPEDFEGGSIATANVNGLITYVNKTEKYFATAAATFRYDANDTFDFGDGVPRDASYFEARLTQGDLLVSGTYAPTAAQVSSFLVTNQVPAVPTTITQINTATTTTSAQVTVSDISTTAGDNPIVRIYGGLNTNASLTRANASLLATATADANTTAPGFQVNLSGLSAGATYTVWATQEIGGEESARTAGAGGTSVATSLAATPVSNGVTLIDVGATGPGTGGTNSVLDQGDRIDFNFTSPVTLASTWSIVLRDDAGRERTLTNANSTASVLGSSSNILRVTVGAGGPDVGVGIGNLNLSELQVASATGVSNGTGAWNLPGSSSRNIAQTNVPEAPDGTMGHPTVTLSAGGDNVSVADLTIDTEYLVSVYTLNGVLVGSATATTNGSGVFAATAIGANVAGTTDYLVTYQATSGDTRASIAATVSSAA